MCAAAMVGVLVVVVVAACVALAAAAAAAAAVGGSDDPGDVVAALHDSLGRSTSHVDEEEVTDISTSTEFSLPSPQVYPAEEVLLRMLRTAAAASMPPTAPNDTPGDNNNSGVVDSQRQVGWRCLMAWMKAHDRHVSQNQPGGCRNHTTDSAGESDVRLSECAPLLFLVVPSLCNGTQTCVNLSQSSLDDLLHRYWTWQRRKKQSEEADDAVIYIVVVLAFYSFGIVFMMANFVRQEQREVEETKMYKQYVKLARDRWLTTRGNMANKLALQALNTFNAVPQTTDVNKVTFV